MRYRSVTHGKTAQLQRTLMALGVYLRKFFLSKLESDDCTVDTKGFGRFSLVTDPSVDPDDLYPKKIVYEPTGALARSAKHTVDQSGSRQLPAAMPIDMGRLTRLCGLQSQNAVKRNIELLSSHLA